MTRWDDGVAALLVGTERRPGLSEVELLVMLSREATRRRAGVRTVHRQLMSDHASPETLVECSGKSAQLLDLALSDHFGTASKPVLARTWLTACRRAGRIVPPQLVRPLLELGTRDITIRAEVRAVIGERGRWMAAMSDRWGWAEADAAAADVDPESAPVDVLRDRLRDQRRTDPSAGQVAIVEAVAGLAAADRAELYGALEEGLSLDDEPLLESMLDDRSTKIRRVAVDLLAQLPGSAWSGRMADRIDRLVAVRRSGSKLTVQLPETLDAAAGRDGIVEKPPPGTGRQAWWLRQIVAGVPLLWWVQVSGSEPGELVARPPLPEIRAGWIDAVRRQRDATWAAALFDAAPDPDLLELLDEATATDRLIAAAKGKRPFRNLGINHLAGLLAAGPERWSTALSLAVVDLAGGIKRESAASFRPLFTLLGRADPTVLDQLVRLAGRFPDSIDRLVREAINQLTFTTSVEEEFT